MTSQDIFNLLSGYFFLVLDLGMTIDRDSYQAAVPMA